MQIIRLLKDKMKESGITVSKFSNDTGIPAPRIYKWLDGKNNPKYDDIKTIERWLIANGVILKDSQNNPLVLGKLNPLEGYVSKEWRVIRLLIYELAAINSRVSGNSFEDCLYELEKKIDIILSS
jgi:transcriptional regulator with XRE-family HTH domain